MSTINIDSNVLEGVVQYIQGTDSLMSKQASFDAAVEAQTEEVITKLAKANLIPEATKEATVQKIKEDPTYVFDVLSKVASIMETVPAGAGSEQTKQASKKLTSDEAFIQALLD